MIGYVTLGTNDMKRSAAFYDKLLAEIGAKRMMDQETFIVWGNSPSQAALSVTKPFDGKAATVGNGVMVALIVKEPRRSIASTRKRSSWARRTKARPARAATGFYAGYFRDPDGNKLNVFCMT